MKQLFLTLFGGLLAFLSLNLQALDEPQVVDSRLLFDFAQSTEKSLEEWKYIPWGKGLNRAHFTKDAKRGAKIVFPQKEFTKGAYPAPNIVYDFSEPQDWSKYNFLVVKLFNPMDENMPLWIDIYSSDNPDGAAIFNWIPSGESELRIPLSRYVNFRRPLNIRQVNRFCFIQRDIQRDVSFTLESVRLEAVRAPEQRYEFPGLSAWQFTPDAKRSKPGFNAVTAPEGFWSGAAVSIKDNSYLKSFAKKFDPMWLSSATGTGASDLTLTAPDGNYLLALYLRGSENNLFDSVLSVDGMPEKRIIIGTNCFELAFFRVKAVNNKVVLHVKPGRADAPWSITAAALVPEKNSEEILRDFIYPAFDDCNVQIRELRTVLHCLDVVPQEAVKRYDLYKQSFVPGALASDTNEIAFALTPKINLIDCTLKITEMKNAAGEDVPRDFITLESVMPYVRSKNGGYTRLPRFFMPLPEFVSLRGNAANYFAVRGTSKATPGVLTGKIAVTGMDGVSEIPFTLHAAGAHTPDKDFNAFLYYYPLGHSNPSDLRREAAELAFVRESSLSALEFPLMTGANQCTPEGKFTCDLTPMKNFMKKYLAQGPRGNGTIPVYLLPQLNTVNYTLAGTDKIFSGKLVDKSIQGVVDAAVIAEKVRKEMNWPEFVYYLFDEYGSFELTTRYNRAVRDAGCPVYTTSVGIYGNGFVPSKEDGLEVYCYSRNFGNVDPVKVGEKVKQQGSRFWGYSVAGSSTLLSRFSWGLYAWHLKLTGYGSWHFNNRKFSPSELLTADYFYAYASYGPDAVTPATEYIALEQGLADRRRLIELEKQKPDSKLVKRFHKAAAKLHSATAENIMQWYCDEGEAMYRELYSTATDDAKNINE